MLDTSDSCTCSHPGGEEPVLDAAAIAREFLDTAGAGDAGTAASTGPNEGRFAGAEAIAGGTTWLEASAITAFDFPGESTGATAAAGSGSARSCSISMCERTL